MIATIKPEALGAIMGEANALAKSLLTAKDAEIAALKKQLAEAEADLKATRMRLLNLQVRGGEDYLTMAVEWQAKADAAEAANKRLRAETIEECAKEAERHFNDSRRQSKVIAAAIRALASETSPLQGGSDA